MPPRFLALPRDAVLTVDSTLNLTCLASGDPFPQISWFKDGWRNISRARITQRNTSLVIMNVTISDEGIYECRVNNRAGDDTSTAKVVVHGTLSDNVFFVMLISEGIPFSLSNAIKTIESSKHSTVASEIS